MKDKQIIIDGVNVAECVYCVEEKCILKDDECCFFPNCSYKQKEKYKNALKEIKEIAEPFCNACLEFEPEKNCSNCIYCNYGEILQKINEVLNA